MSRHSSFQFRGEREGRVAQMSRQEEVIARKRQELLEKQKTNELAKKVAAAQSSAVESTPAAATLAVEVKPPLNLPKQTFAPDPPPPKNTFTNDGSFFENFRKITEEAKKAEDERQKIEAERLAKEKELEQAELDKAEQLQEQMVPPMAIPSLDSAFSTNSMSMGPPPHIKDPNLFNQNIPPFININFLEAAPPPPPPPPPAIEPIDHPMAIPPIMNSNQPIMNHPPPAQPPPPPFMPALAQPPPHIQQPPPQFEGNNYLNENQMNRHCGNVEQMERNVNINPHQTQNLQPLNSEMPMIQSTSNQAAAKPPIPTTIDGLIEFIANNGDEHEEKIIAEIAQMNERTLFRFLHDKDSENYQMYRHKVVKYRVEKLGQPPIVDSSEKYDPEDILRDDEADHPPAIVLSQSQKSNDSDEYDSDSEYMQETMERNLENMKRKIDSGTAKKRYADNSSQYSSDDADHTDEEDHMEMYRKIQMRESALSQDEDQSGNQPHSETSSDRNRKKRSRWGDKVAEMRAPQAQMPAPSVSNQPFAGNKPGPKLSAVKRTDPALLNYARQNYGSVDLTEEDWTKCEEHFKVNLLYHDMLRKRDELDRLAKSGKQKYEYDSDEDITGGTWEHKMRNEEMEATAAWADALNKQSEGKHHIGDFLPPEELKKFMEIYKSKQTNREPDLSDYKEYKLKEDNKGFQMLQKLGWTEGQGLGVDGGGIINPVNKATQRDSNQGLGTASNTTPEAGDNEYDAYRKRMMLAYRFRPNPLNNPRRAYY